MERDSRRWPASGQSGAGPLILCMVLVSWQRPICSSNSRPRLLRVCVQLQVFPLGNDVPGGPFKARWAADWRPVPPLTSWQCTATRPELWLASTLLRKPACGDS